MARGDAILVKTEHGDSFVVTQADDLADEAQMLRKNQRFLDALDALKADDEAVPLEQVEKELR